MKIAVLAGTHQQFRLWLEDQPAEDRPKYHFVSRPEQAYGCEFESYREIGTCYELPEYPDLLDLVKTRIRPTAQSGQSD